MNILLAMIPAFFWGTTYAVTQFTLPDWPPLLLGILRALPAGLLLWLVKPSFPAAKDWRPLLIVGTINIGAFFCLIFLMAHTLPSAISGVGMISVPVFAMLFQWVVFKQRPSVIRAICGFGLIVLAWQLFDPSHLSLSPLGMIAMLGAILCMIAGSTYTQKLGQKVHWWTTLTWQLILGGLVLIPVTVIHALNAPEIYVAALTHIDWNHIAGLIWICVLNTALAYGLYVWLLQRMSVVDFTFGGIANPVAGISCGFLLLGETFTTYQYLLMVGMIIMSLAPQCVMQWQKARRSALALKGECHSL
ncbi:DMT family transporter [Vibrio porteresiae]|uniref:EamA family transporter n=1 Tax=Vibrio porteresiae DSM 19223 TaxID=1123496 RepID=A0ABZ0QFU9_9VIBR|nr:EamA family transporter [Vibrio porteresiae]WPC75343.1 EamA family transporter [Vibrio porteresiae DSM 19223]